MPRKPSPLPDTSLTLVSAEVVVAPPPAEERDTRQQTQDEDARKAALLAEALERWAIVEDAEADQRQRELEDLRFFRALPEDQWPEAVMRERAGGIQPNGRYVPPRPCLTVNKLDQPIQQIVAEARNSRLSIQIKPKGEKTSPKHAELRTGLIRQIEVDSHAHVARIAALERAAVCGRGYYRILTDYCNDGDFDQDLRIAGILDQACVYLDPHAREPDWSDMEWAFATTDMTPAEYRRRFGQDAPKRLNPLEELSGSQEGFVSTTDVPPTWISDDSVRVAEYWYVVPTECELVQEPMTGERYWADPWPGGGKPPRLWTQYPVWDATVLGPIPAEAKRRTVPVRSVKWALITAQQVLDESDWDGRYIPIVAVTGKEYMIEGRRVFKGVVANSKDAQRANNYMISALIERVGLGSKAPYILDPRQIEGFEDAWLRSNTSNLPYLPYDGSVTAADGHPLPMPQRNLAEPDIQAITVALGVSDSAIKATTGRFDPSLGNLSGNERSGRAIRELKQQGEQATSIYLDKLATVSMAYEGRVLLDLLPAIYDRPGRLLRLLGETQDDERTALVKTPYVPGPDGRPVVVPPGQRAPQPMPPPPMPPQGGMPGMPPPQGAAPGPGGPGMMPPGMPPIQMPPPPPEEPIWLDLSEGDYAVTVSVGKSFATQREQNLDLITTMVEATKGQAAPMLIDLWAEMLDGPMSRRMADRFRALNPNLKGKDEPGGLPPQVQAQVQQMQQALQQTQAQLAEATQAVEAQAAKAEADLRAKQLEVESRERVEALRVQTSVEIERIKSERERTLQDDQQAHEVAMQQQKLRLELEHQQALETLRLTHAKESAETSAQYAREQAERDAALKRELATTAAKPMVRKVKRDERGYITELEG